MRINVDEEHSVYIILLEDYPPIARHINAALMFPMPGELVIVEERVEWFLHKYTKSLCECETDFSRKFVALFLESACRDRKDHAISQDPDARSSLLHQKIS